MDQQIQQLDEYLKKCEDIRRGNFWQSTFSMLASFQSAYLIIILLFTCFYWPHKILFDMILSMLAIPEREVAATVGDPNSKNPKSAKDGESGRGVRKK